MKYKLFAVAGLIAISLLVKNLPWERQTSGLSQILYRWGEEQSERADRWTSVVVDEYEGHYVGERAIDGSNWSIPNILRHWLGGD